MTDQNLEQVSETETPSNEEKTSSYKNENQTTNSLGTYLIELRESKETSLKQISIETKITETVLKNIELGKFDELPKKIYLQGFIKTYCQYLGESHTEALRLLDQEFSQEDNRPNIEGRVNLYDGVSNSATALLPKIIFVGVIVIGTALYWNYSNTEAPSEVKAVEKISAEKLTSSTPLLKPTNKAFVQEKSEEPVVAVEEKKKEESVEETQKVTFKPFPKTNYILSKNTNIDEIFSENSLIAESEFSEIVVIKASRGDSWIAYQKNDKEIKQVILKEGKELYLTGDFIKVVIGNSTAIDLLHNKKLLEVASDSGIRSLAFPPTTERKLQLPFFYTNEKNEFVASPEL